MKRKYSEKMAPLFLTCKNKKMLIIKDTNIEPLPIMAMACFDNDFLPNPFIKNPIKGNNGTRYAKLFIPLIFQSV
jgi:hypothetical protein